MTSLATPESLTAYTDEASILASKAANYKLGALLTKLAKWLETRMQEGNNAITPWGKLLISDAGGLQLGGFSHTEWTLKIMVARKNDLVSSIRVRYPNMLKEYVDNLLHEAFHCEQYFTMARVLAMGGMDANQIYEKLMLPRTIRVAAVESAKKLNDQQKSADNELVDRWPPWITDFEVTKWRNRVSSIKEVAIRMLSTADGDYADTKPAAIQKLTADLVKPREELEKVTEVISRGSSPIKDTIDHLTKEVSERCGNMENLANLYNKSDSSDVTKERFKAWTGEDGAIQRLYKITYQIYKVDDPVEAAAWKLGNDAGEEFGMKMKQSNKKPNQKT